MRVRVSVCLFLRAFVCPRAWLGSRFAFASVVVFCLLFFFACLIAGLLVCVFVCSVCVCLCVAVCGFACWEGMGRKVGRFVVPPFPSDMDGHPRVCSQRVPPTGQFEGLLKLCLGPWAPTVCL